MSEFEQVSINLISAGQQLYAKGMVPATSGNFSTMLSDGNIAITVSGAHKGQLKESDIMRINRDGLSLDERKPSAETLLHTHIYQRYPAVNTVLHPHSINATLLSLITDDCLKLQDYEILKAFPGINTHDCTVSVPIFDNDQDITRLAEKADKCLASYDNPHGYLIRAHGFYTWGESMKDALRHVEAFEFLFDCELQLRRLKQ